jgi:hypothetical protein
MKRQQDLAAHTTVFSVLFWTPAHEWVVQELGTSQQECVMKERRKHKKQ